jgi:hypothetical protein
VGVNRTGSAGAATHPMNEHIESPDDSRGCGRGLAAWILASYTDPGDTVLDLDDDPGLQITATTMRRTHFVPPAGGLGRSRERISHPDLVIGSWPRPTPSDPALPSDHETLADLAGTLAPAGRLVLVVFVPTPTGPVVLHPRSLLAAAHDAGLGHPDAVHVVAAQFPDGPSDHALSGYRCALVFRRTGRHTPRRP